MTESKKEEKNRLEFRLAGAKKFYAPDRDMLTVTPAIIKAALRLTLNYVDRAVLTDDKVDELVDAAAGVHLEALGPDKAEKVLSIFHERMAKLDPAIQIQFFRGIVDSFVLGYVNSLRDAAEKPVLTEQQLMASMESLSVMSALDPKDVEAARIKATMLGVLSPSFCEVTGLYEMIQAEKEEEEEKEEKE